MIDEYGIERELTPEERRDFARAAIRTQKMMIVNIAMDDQRFDQLKADEWLAKEDSY